MTMCMSSNTINVQPSREGLGKIRSQWTYQVCMNNKKIPSLLRLNAGMLYVSRTPDSDFRCFYPCKIILSHIPVPARGKDKKRTATRQPHAFRTSICDVIVGLKLSHPVASQRIQDFLDVFFIFFKYKMRYLVVSKKKNTLFLLGWDRKTSPSRSLFVITRQALWCQSMILGKDFSHTYDGFLDSSVWVGEWHNDYDWGQFMSFWYLSHMQTAKAPMSLTRAFTARAYKVQR